jgi:hypothetical protein
MNTLRVVILTAILIASLGACSSAGKCRRGELGCACQTGTCEPGASCVAERCTKSAAGVGGSGGDSDGGGGGGRDSSTAGGDASDLCSAVSFDAACRSYCVAFCESQSAFCERSVCPPQYCTSAGYTAEVRPACEQICGDNADCVQGMCIDQRRIVCNTFFSTKEDGGVDPGCFDNDPKCELRAN